MHMQHAFTAREEAGTGLRVGHSRVGPAGEASCSSLSGGSSVPWSGWVIM